MKKILALLCCFIFVFSAAACGNENANEAALSQNTKKDESKNDECLFEITDYEISPVATDYYEVIYTIKNISDGPLTFKGISIKEFDSDNTIIGDYYSYNKHAMETEVEPGQSLKLDLTFAYEDEICKIETSKYCYKDENGTLYEERFDEIFTAYINSSDEDEKEISSGDATEVVRQLETILKDDPTYYGCEYNKDLKAYIFKFAEEGIADDYLKSANGLDEFEETVNQLCSTMKESFELSGYDCNVIIYILNDYNRDNILFASMNGITAYSAK